MKVAKNIWICLLVLCLLFGLSACGRKNASESDWIWAYNRQGAFSDKGYYFLTNNGFLRFVDTSNGVSVCLCSKVGCLHDQEPDARKSENCEARLIGASLITPLFFWDDHLYYILEDEYGLQVYRRDAAGAGLETVATLGEQYTKQKKDVTVYAYAVSNGYLYYTADVDGSVRSEDGVHTVQWETNYLGRLELKTGKEEILLENSDAYITLCAVKGNNAIFHTAGVPDLDYEDPNFREARLQMPAALQHWDGKTGKASILLEKKFHELKEVNAVYSGKIYYTASTDAATVTYAYDLSADKSEIASEAVLRHIGNGYALRLDPKNEQWQLYDLRTKKILPNALSQNGFWVETVSGDGFVLRRTVEDTPAGRQQMYSYVTFAALSDGLQETDMMTFYSYGLAAVD